MKKIALLLIILISTLNVYSQAEAHNHKVLNEKEALELFNYTNFIKDFTKITVNQGYDFKSDACLRNFYTINHSNLLAEVFELYRDEKNKIDYVNLYIEQLKKFEEYLPLFAKHESALRAEYNRQLNSSVFAKQGGGNPTPQAACTNMNIEAGNLSGWSTNSANVGPSFSNLWTPAGANSAFASTPGPDAVVPAINKVFAGGFSACIDVLGSGNGIDWRELQQTFLVTNANKDFVFYTAVITDGGAHACADNPFFTVSVLDASNNVIPCSNISLIGSATGGGPCSTFNGWNTAGFYDFLNWTPVIVPLGAYVGQNVTVKFRVQRCTAYGHGARAYIEASCNPVDLTVTGNLICPGKTVSLVAPNTPGYNYSWTGPSGFSASTNSITPSLSGAYTVTMSLISNPTCKMIMDTILVSVPSPTANFVYTVTPCAPTNSVPVVSTSTPAAGDPISSYTWVWGDATANGSGGSNNHTYASVGTKTVELKIVSAAGCRDSIKHSFSFNPGPVASFNLANGCLGTISNFTSTSTSATGIASQNWNWGDGSANGSGTNASHTYTAAGTYTVNLLVTAAAGGCTVSISHPITIYPKPTITFTANPVCLNVATSFTNTSSILGPDVINSWAWDFDNNGTTDNTTQITSNTFTPAGTYNVELKATSNNGCSDSLLVPIKVNALPTASFTPVNACINSNVIVNNTSTIPAPDNILSYSWNFGTAASPATGNIANPTPLIYTTSGVKTIVLNITSNTTCTATITQTVTVFPQPIANFSTTSVCQSTATSFTDLSTPTGSISAWNWDFTNNGSIDNTTATPTNVFVNSGTFSTSLVVTSTNGCKDTITLPVSVWGHAIPDFSVTTVCLNLANSFTNLTDTLTNANVGVNTSWSWDFADGSALSTLQNPSHTYALGATYNVTLTATTINGCIDSITKSAVVNVLPTATFTPVNACLNSNVLLNNASVIPLPNTVSSYTWSFGANASPVLTSNIQNPPILMYNTSGIKTITLNITSNTTCTASITQTVEVYPQPVASFSATSVCQSLSTTYTDLSTTSAGTITGWSWDYTNNGSVDNASSSPSTVFLSSGTFTSSLIVTTSNGCKDTITLPINVWGHTIPDFSPNNVCFGTSTTFVNNTNTTTNANVGTTPSYSWNFADGSGTQILVGNPSHTYVLGGNVNAVYNVTLSVTSSHSCIDSIIKVVNVYAIPTASFTSDQVCLGFPSHMFDASNGNGNVVSNYIWDFLSNGTIDATGVSNPSFTFPVYGNNAVTYTATSTPTVGLTCKNVTNTITVLVNPNPVPNFTFVNKCINAQPNTFDASTSTIAVGTNTAYTWAFGDGATSPSSITPTHNYATAGLFNTTLTVTSDQGCQTSIVKQVEVYQKPLMSITASNACFNSATSFTAVSLAGSGVVNFWGWDFNNVISTMESFGQTTSFVFPAAGNQTVHLVASTAIGGCVETFTLPIYVDYVPVPNFTVDIPSGCPELCVKFTDNTPALTAPGVNATWQWSFGDGQIITANSGTVQPHCYNNSSSSQLALYDVTLTVTSDKGCKGSLTKPAFITVYPTPIAQYTVNPNPGSILTPLEQFTNQSVDFTKWWWCFGDGPISDSTHLNPLHNYTSDNADSYYSYLIVANQYGCKSTANVKVEIQPEFLFYIPNAFTPENEDGHNDFFTGMGIGIDTYEMWIFDRWGVSIYYTDDIHKGWNGRVQGKEALVQQDVYIWKVKLKDVLGKKHDYVGHVTVLR